MDLLLTCARSPVQVGVGELNWWGLALSDFLYEVVYILLRVVEVRGDPDVAAVGLPPSDLNPLKRKPSAGLHGVSLEEADDGGSG